MLPWFVRKSSNWFVFCSICCVESACSAAMALSAVKIVLLIVYAWYNNVPVICWMIFLSCVVARGEVSAGSGYWGCAPYFWYYFVGSPSPR